jgi:hypothetical protein
MAKKKGKGKGKGRKATTDKAVVVSTPKAERINTFEGQTYLDGIFSAYGAKPLTERQSGAYEANQLAIDSKLKPRVDKLTRGFCSLEPYEKQSEQDKELLDGMLTKMIRQEVNPFVTAPAMVWNLEKLGVSEEDFAFIVDTIQQIHGVNIMESGAFLDEAPHLEQVSKNVWRTLQGFLLGSPTAYNRKNLHNSRAWSKVVACIA